MSHILKLLRLRRIEYTQNSESLKCTVAENRSENIIAFYKMIQTKDVKYYLEIKFEDTWNTNFHKSMVRSIFK